MFTILKKVVVTVFTLKKGGNRAGSTPVPKKLFFMQKYKAVEKAVKQKRQRFFGNATAGLNKLAKRGSRLKKGLRLFNAASNAASFNLPSKFAGDLGLSFIVLIQEAILDKKNNYPSQNNDYQSITGLELWQFVNKNRTNSKHIAYRFANYSEKEIRMLSKDWLQLEVTMRSFAKMLSNIGSYNSPQHYSYLKLLKLTEKNASLWLTAVFRDRIALDVHSFRVVTSLGNAPALRMTYHVPIPIRPANFPKNKKKQKKNIPSIIASDTTKFFNTNLVSFKIVIEIKYNYQTGSFENKKAQLITGFLQDKPLKNDDIQTMLNPSPNKFFWGGSKGTTQLYINSIGKTGLKALPTLPFFEVLQKATDYTARQIELKYPNRSIFTHYQKKDKNGNPTGPLLSLKSTSARKDIALLANDSGYILETYNRLKGYLNNVNKTYANLLALLIQNKMV